MGSKEIDLDRIPQHLRRAVTKKYSIRELNQVRTSNKDIYNFINDLKDKMYVGAEDIGLYFQHTDTDLKELFLIARFHRIGETDAKPMLRLSTDNFVESTNFRLKWLSVVLEEQDNKQLSDDILKVAFSSLRMKFSCNTLYFSTYSSRIYKMIAPLLEDYTDLIMETCEEGSVDSIVGQPLRVQRFDFGLFHECDDAIVKNPRMAEIFDYNVIVRFKEVSIHCLFIDEGERDASFCKFLQRLYHEGLGSLEELSWPVHFLGRDGRLPDTTLPVQSVFVASRRTEREQYIVNKLWMLETKKGQSITVFDEEGCFQICRVCETADVIPHIFNRVLEDAVRKQLETSPDWDDIPIDYSCLYDKLHRLERTEWQKPIENILSRILSAYWPEEKMNRLEKM